ncbi:Ppx/GppA phosphatase family-domain-containing protein [Gongronella butleri]|nr:Ppx/GppA phosphatase family-domain-containing protein [Gongronella butleri]
MTTDGGPLAIVDMGSNGIRFGIADELQRHLPVTYEERVAISLLEAQGDAKLIPDDTIDQVVSAFQRFKALCDQANVPTTSIHVVATEATRVAANADVFMDRLFAATGWHVRLLSKQEEALISASGVVGSCYQVQGLTSDCGGGSVELSYVLTGANHEVEVAPTPISLPFGSVVMKRRLDACGDDEDALAALYDELVAGFKDALAQVSPPEQLKHETGSKHSSGFDLYMSGGSFRALGYLSMAKKKSKIKSQYPLPMINGYSMSGKALFKLAHKYKTGDPADIKGFRISKRRASMMPAVCFLVTALLDVVPIRRVHFSEGGVRQGYCYQQLSRDERAKDPLLCAASALARRLQHGSCGQPSAHEVMVGLMRQSLPSVYFRTDHPLQLHRLVPAAVTLAQLTSAYPKESRAVVAFHLPLASGPLANAPGLTHRDRAILSLILAYAQGGAVHDPLLYSIQCVAGKKGLAMAKYLGHLLELIFIVSPLNPGIGLIDTGVAFVAQDMSAAAMRDASLYRSMSVSSLSMESEENDDNDETDRQHDWTDQQDDDTDIDMYPPVKLAIHMPPPASHPLLNSPVIASLFENLNGKINRSKQDAVAIKRDPSLFSVSIVPKFA